MPSVIQAIIYHLFDFFFKAFVSNLVFNSGAYKASHMSKELVFLPGFVILLYSKYRSCGILPKRSHANKDSCWLCSVVSITNYHSLAEKVKHQKAFKQILKCVFQKKKNTVAPDCSL